MQPHPDAVCGSARNAFVGQEWCISVWRGVQEWMGARRPTVCRVWWWRLPLRPLLKWFALKLNSLSGEVRSCNDKTSCGEEARGCAPLTPPVVAPSQRLQGGMRVVHFITRASFEIILEDAGFSAAPLPRTRRPGRSCMLRTACTS